MKTPRCLLLLLTLLLAVLSPRPAQARVETSFDFFYDSLSPYGEWVEVAGYGSCWRPTDVDPDWAPYADGYWAFTDAGWTWVSYEDFGGVVYHYGRWVRVEDEGWCWVPDYEWGPAWVSWRDNDDYVGWAPLPPEARWQPSIGISTWVDRDCDIGPAYYNFCRVRDFGAPFLRPVIINRIQNVTIIRRTVNITNITYNTHYGNGPVIYNGGPSFAVINQRSDRRVPALKLVQNSNIDLAGLRDGNRGDRRRNFNGQAVGNQLVVSAPFVKPPADPGFLKTHVKKVFAADKVSRGWNGVKNEEVRRELKQEMQRQTKGLTRETAPARAVAASDLKVLPEKADPQAPSPIATRDQRDRPGKGSRTPEVAGQPSTPATTPPDADEKKGRGPASRDSQKPGEPGLKPFNPVTGPDSRSRRGTNPAVTPPEATKDPRVAKPGDDRGRTPNADAPDPKSKMLPDQEKARRQAESGAQQQQQMDAQRQAEAQRQQQRESAAAAARQRMQAEQGNAARQQAEAAATQEKQKQAEALRRQQGDAQAAKEQGRQAAEQQQQRMQRDRGDAAEQTRRVQEGQQRQAEALRRQQGDQQAAEQQRRQAAEQQQRGQREAAEQARRAQGAQQAAEQQRRQVMEQQQRGQRDAAEQSRRGQENQRPQRTAPPSTSPSTAPGATPSDSDQQGRRNRRN